MQSFDEVALREAPQIETLSPQQLLEVRARVRADLFHGRDGWPAINWIAATRDTAAKQRLIQELSAVMNGATNTLLEVDGAVDNFGSEIVFGRAAQERRRMSRAFDYVTALQASLVQNGVDEDDGPSAVDVRFEEEVAQRRRTTEQHAARQDELSRLGMQPGRGVPFWELYMRRRRKKSWG